MPPRELSAVFISNLSRQKAKEILKKNVFRYIGTFFIAKAERDELLSLFSILDTNKDGHLSRDELKDGLIKLFGNRIRNIDNEVNKIMAEADLDQSGEISYSEFVTFTIDHEKLLNRNRLEAVFNSLDANNSGTIDASEFREIFSKFADVDHESIDAMIRECDLNGDGVIDLAEFTSLMLKL